MFLLLIFVLLSKGIAQAQNKTYGCSWHLTGGINTNYTSSFIKKYKSQGIQNVRSSGSSATELINLVDSETNKLNYIQLTNGHVKSIQRQFDHPLEPRFLFKTSSEITITDSLNTSNLRPSWPNSFSENIYVILRKEDLNEDNLKTGNISIEDLIGQEFSTIDVALVPDLKSILLVKKFIKTINVIHKRFSEVSPEILFSDPFIVKTANEKMVFLLYNLEAPDHPKIIEVLDEFARLISNRLKSPNNLLLYDLAITMYGYLSSESKAIAEKEFLPYVEELGKHVLAERMASSQ